MAVISLFSILLTVASLIVYYAVKKNQWVVLLIASALFMSVYAPLGFLCLTAESLAVWLLMRKASKASGLKTRKVLTLISVCLIFAFYVCLKYVFTQNTPGLSLLSTRHILDVPLSLGSAYFLLRLISFTVDTSNGKVPENVGYFRFLTYLIYYPALCQGPVEKYVAFSEKLEGRHTFTLENLNRAVFLILYGLFKIFAIAKVCALYSPLIFSVGDNTYTPGFLLFCVVMYSIQIYADFSGGIDLIRGISFLFDVQLIENFRTPYFSTGFSEFWRRWHISFSNWLKDYIYIPLGGSRKGKARKYLNTAAVFIVSGLWHGVSIPFLIWGGLQAAYSVGETAIRKNRPVRHPVPNRILVFVAMSFSWIFFHASSLGDIAAFFGNCVKSVENLKAYVSGFVNATFSLGQIYVKLLHNYLQLDSKRFLICATVVFIFFIFLEYRLYKRDKGIETICEGRKGISWALFLVLLLTVVFFGFWGDSYAASDFIYGGF